MNENINTVLLDFCIYKCVNKYSSIFNFVIQVWHDDCFIYVVPYYFVIS
jgi:hypothetical protein